MIQGQEHTILRYVYLRYNWRYFFREVNRLFVELVDLRDLILAEAASTVGSTDLAPIEPGARKNYYKVN